MAVNPSEAQDYKDTLPQRIASNLRTKEPIYETMAQVAQRQQAKAAENERYEAAAVAEEARHQGVMDDAGERSALKWSDAGHLLGGVQGMAAGIAGKVADRWSGPDAAEVAMHDLNPFSDMTQEDMGQMAIDSLVQPIGYAAVARPTLTKGWNLAKNAVGKPIAAGLDALEGSLSFLGSKFGGFRRPAVQSKDAENMLLSNLTKFDEARPTLGTLKIAEEKALENLNASHRVTSLRKNRPTPGTKKITHRFGNKLDDHVGGISGKPYAKSLEKQVESWKSLPNEKLAEMAKARNLPEEAIYDGTYGLPSYVNRPGLSSQLEGMGPQQLLKAGKTRGMPNSAFYKSTGGPHGVGTGEFLPTDVIIANIKSDVSRGRFLPKDKIISALKQSHVEVNATNVLGKLKAEIIEYVKPFGGSVEAIPTPELVAMHRHLRATFMKNSEIKGLPLLKELGGFFTSLEREMAKRGMEVNRSALRRHSGLRVPKQDFMPGSLGDKEPLMNALGNAKSATRMKQLGLGHRTSDYMDEVIRREKQVAARTAYDTKTKVGITRAWAGRNPKTATFLGGSVLGAGTFGAIKAVDEAQHYLTPDSPESQSTEAADRLGL